MLIGLLVLVTCQVCGEAVVAALDVPVPGAVVGMLLLLAVLVLRGRAAPEPVARAGDTLLGNLGLLFVPAGVGVVQYGGLLAAQWRPVLGGLVGAWATGLVVTGGVVQGLLSLQRRRSARTSA